MQLNKNDLPMVRSSLITLVLALFLSGTFIMLNVQHTRRAQQDFQSAQHKLQNAQSQLHQAQQAQRDLADYGAEYTMAVQQHLLGAEPRLDILDALEKLRSEKIVSHFNYTLSPQKIELPPDGLDLGNFELRSSAIKLQFELLHEQQLLNFLDALRQQNGFQLQTCKLQHTEVASNNTQLVAECNGAWITLQKRSDPP